MAKQDVLLIQNQANTLKTNAQISNIPIIKSLKVSNRQLNIWHTNNLITKSFESTTTDGNSNYHNKLRWKFTKQECLSVQGQPPACFDLGTQT